MHLKSDRHLTTEFISYICSIHIVFTGCLPKLNEEKMLIPIGKLIAIGGAEDKGTTTERGDIYKNNLNFFELGILRRIVEEIGGLDPTQGISDARKRMYGVQVLWQLSNGQDFGVD